MEEREARWVRGAGRGAVAAMAMTGVRRVTTGLGWLERPPPERMAREAAPGLLARISPERRKAAIELAHWTYGAAAGVAFARLPSSVRRRRLTGVSYGVAIWLAFELVARPVLPLREPKRKTRERVALLVDHALYGVVLAARSPQPP
jgi:hypothetical protein